MIDNLGCLDAAGVLVGTSYPTYRERIAGLPMPKTYVLRGAFSFFSSSACVTLDDKLVAPPNFDNLHAPAHSSSLEALIQRSQTVPEVRLPNQKLCLLTASWSELNIYHCYIDTIGKLSVLSQFCDIKSFTYLIPSTSSITAQVFNILDLPVIGYDSRQTKYTANDLTVVSLPGVTSKPSAGLMSYLSHLMDAIPPSPFKRNVYVKRLKRGIENEAPLLNLIEKYLDFEVVLLEEMPLRDQVSIIRDSGIVFGPHGAGFAHTAFKKSGTLFEIFGPDYANPPYKNMHSQSCVNYLAYFPSDNLPEKYGKIVHQNMLPNFTVDIDRFERFFLDNLEKMLSF